MSDRYQRLDEEGLARAVIIAGYTEHSVLELVENTVEQRRGGE